MFLSDKLPKIHVAQCFHKQLFRDKYTLPKMYHGVFVVRAVMNSGTNAFGELVIRDEWLGGTRCFRENAMARGKSHSGLGTGPEPNPS